MQYRPIFWYSLEQKRMFVNADKRIYNLSIVGDLQTIHDKTNQAIFPAIARVFSLGTMP